MGYSYGAVQYEEPAIYVANDDDYYEDWEDEQSVPLGETEDHAEEEVEVSEELVPIQFKLSELPSEVYWDESALTNCWEAALADYKFHHPSYFGPPREAPRSQAKKHDFAPLWYGPAPPIPPSGGSVTSSSTSKSAQKKRKAAAAKLSSAPSPAPSPAPQQTGNKKRKTTHASTEPGRPYSPISPSRQRAPSLEPPPHLSALSTIVGPRLPSPNSFVPPQLPRVSSTAGLPGSFPPPPPFVELTPAELSTIAEAKLQDEASGTTDGDEGNQSPEELLQAALWAWYNAGYQTGVYHAAVGVAGVGSGAAADGSGAK